MVPFKTYDIYRRSIYILGLNPDDVERLRTAGELRIPNETFAFDKPLMLMTDFGSAAYEDPPQDVYSLVLSRAEIADLLDGVVLNYSLGWFGVDGLILIAHRETDAHVALELAHHALFSHIQKDS